MHVFLFCDQLFIELFVTWYTNSEYHAYIQHVTLSYIQAITKNNIMLVF